jgi:hypothetical protein
LFPASNSLIVLLISKIAIHGFLNLNYYGGSMRFQKLSKMTVGAVALCTVAGFAIAAVGSGPYKLAFRMKKGDRLKYKMSMATEQTMEMMGQEMTTTVNGYTHMHMDVEDVAKDGSITLVYAIDSMNVDVQGPQGSQSFKSPAELVGKRTRVTINAYGKKLSSAIVDSAKLSGMLAQLGVGRQNAFNLMELSEKEVKSGDTWSVSRTDTMSQGGGKVIVTPSLTYTVGGEVDTLGYKCVRIVSQGNTAIKGEGSQMGSKFFIEGQGPGSGVAYFAPKEGLLVASTSVSDLEMTIAVTGQQNMTIPQSTSQKFSLVLVK